MEIEIGETTLKSIAKYYDILFNCLLVILDSIYHVFFNPS